MAAVPHFPDHLTLPQFLLDYQHPIRLPREAQTPWLVDARSGESLLQGEVIQRTWNLANGLSSRASIVGIISENNLDFPLTIWAAHRLGASVFGYEASILVVHSSAFEATRTAARKMGIPDDKIVLFDRPILPASDTLFVTIQDLVNAGDSIKQSYQFTEFKMKAGEGKTTTALYFPSSGTTGVPKMVAIPHSSFISNIIQTAAHDAGFGAVVPVVKRRFKPGSVSCAVLPFFRTCWTWFAMTVVILPKFDFVEYLATIKKYKVTHLSLVPPMLTLFCKHPAVKGADLSSLRVVFVGGAPLSVPLAEAMGEIVPHAVVEQGYGMTELTGILTMPPLDRRVATDAVGYLLPGFTARVVKPDGSLAGIGESGELYVTGPSLATHYVNNKKMFNPNRVSCSSEETFIEGWVRTGDEVYFDQDRELHIVDRIKDFIKVGGYQVAPAELEARLVTNPDITDCCVVPIPDQFPGEVPGAYVVLSADARERLRRPSESSKIGSHGICLQDITKNKARYKGLAGGVKFIDAIPKTASGKLLRRALRDLASSRTSSAKL
ncbi:acetyl-CoA synthetase-like protein [Mycena alexandri]|uniref:Acetyl-CoA synthetase-like protein n=1 Tax=Mycena alexandri TaxID=1745969 RepID=A0AAD6SQW2_9AGAR|nr:acetyl-CoA synthetase-like protein [Mycena alexandri]